MNLKSYKRLIKPLIFSAVLVLITVSSGFCACQKLGEYCGSPATDTFPACCPFDESLDDDDEQVPLECKEVNNGVGNCQQAESEEN